MLLFAGTYGLQLSTQIAYTLTDTDPVAEVFPPDNPIVVLYNNADEDAVAALADRLEADPNVKSAMSYSTTLGRQYTATQMADIVGALDAAAHRLHELHEQTHEIILFEHGPPRSR